MSKKGNSEVPLFTEYAYMLENLKNAQEIDIILSDLILKLLKLQQSK